MSSRTQAVLTVPDAGVVVDARTQLSFRPFKGLCVNCDHRFTCIFLRPESGVWYCEEYR